MAPVVLELWNLRGHRLRGSVCEGGGGKDGMSVCERGCDGTGCA